MNYILSEGKICPFTDKTDVSEASIPIYLSAYNTPENNKIPSDFKPNKLDIILNNHSPRFESHENMDVVCYPYIESSSENFNYNTMHLFARPDCLLIYSDQIPIAEEIMQILVKDTTTEISIGYIFFLIFEKLLENDSNYLDSFEEEIIDLEDEVIINKQRKDYVRSIIGFRKRLMYLKRNYEQLLDIFNFMGGNDNSILDQRSLKLLRILSGKVDRLYNSVITLQEYVTQIREAYQAEVDINLNQTMKLFTVITTIFLPLTLIAGWYGMNFDMPEYNLPFGYPIIILISVIIVLITIGFFKKNKWF